jgi:hypothetical protein
MMQEIILPDELLNEIGSETKEFVVYGTRLRPVTGNAITQLIIGILWVGGFIWIGFFLFNEFGPADVTAAAPPEPVINESLTDKFLNDGWAIGLLYLAFLLPGIWNLKKTIVPLLKSGGIFVGTPQRLLNYRKGEIISYGWSEFILKTKVKGNGLKGNLTLTRTTGYYMSAGQRAGGTKFYIPYIVFMSGIGDVFEIEKICKKRIEEKISEKYPELK